MGSDARDGPPTEPSETRALVATGAGARIACDAAAAEGISRSGSRPAAERLAVTPSGG
jgi:hypothetical protein